MKVSGFYCLVLVRADAHANEKDRMWVCGVDI